MPLSDFLPAFRPALLDALPGYDRAAALRDAAAGLTVGVLALPLSMAFAIASGASPGAGLWTAIVGGLVISAFGGSRVQIGGPTGAFIPILYGIVATQGLAAMLAATFLAGLMLLAMGIARLGKLIRYIPVAVVTGFTNGIAVVLLLSQVKDFFGLPGEALPAEFFARLRVLLLALPHANPSAAALAAACLLLVLAWERLARRWPRLGWLPAQLVGLLAGTAAAALLALPVETLGSRFHGIPQGLPALVLPLPEVSALRPLLMPAFTIALLGAIESLLSARVADTRLEVRHDPNQELIAQGLANLLVPFLGGIAATGAIARTATNLRAGGRTPVAGLVHVLVLLLIVLVAAPLAVWVPVPVLAAIVVVTALRMGEWHEFVRLRKFSWNYRAVLLSTFSLTLLFDLTIAVEIGMVLASLLFIARMQDLTRIARCEGAPEVAVFALQGSIFFGAVSKLDAQLDAVHLQCRVLVLDFSRVLNVDTSGIDWLASVRRTLQRRGAQLLLCGLAEQPASLLVRSGLARELGELGVCENAQVALARAESLSRGRAAQDAGDG